ncbi:LacI family DNA-binding transcriptional regulator [Micromonospora sp. NPDC048830]|uniref:LacI family DNA-binding transcriptional regulator n=1 Tax=Micromonospora sp. NPDC048830 TaxID=3364257 RepID=UPI0037130F7A
MGNDRLTVREIARLAGVSVATVSRVSNGVGQVSEETRRRVLRAIEEHGYRPHHLGRALAATAAGETDPLDGGLVLPTDLVVRGSCGCPATTTHDPAATGRRPAAGPER